jgi:hypothetical protein
VIEPGQEGGLRRWAVRRAGPDIVPSATLVLSRLTGLRPSAGVVFFDLIRALAFMKSSDSVCFLGVTDLPVSRIGNIHAAENTRIPRSHPGIVASSVGAHSVLGDRLLPRRRHHRDPVLQPVAALSV